MEGDAHATAAPVAYGCLHPGGAGACSSTDTELMEKPNGRGYRHHAGDGRIYVDAGRRPEA